MATNTLDEKERIARGKEQEARILNILRDKDIVVAGNKIISWEPSSESEDITKKIDAWAITDDARLSVQIKYRDAGTDLGIAAVRPYNSHLMFQMDWQAGTVRWDRDMKHTADIYVCLADYGTKLIVADGHKVKRAVNTMLFEFSKADYFDGRTFEKTELWGAQLKIVRDRGTGYSAGQNKIVCYLNARLLEKSGGMIVNI